MGWLQTNTVRIARIHFVVIFMFAALTIAYDGFNLIPLTALMDRWTVSLAMLVVTTVIWFIARNTAFGTNNYRVLLYALIVMDILVAGFYVYAGRGMASRGVALFALPIIIAAFTLSRSALFATASLCTGIYSYAAIKYFNEHPSEGYNIELYGDLFFYSAGFFIFAALLWTLVRSVQAKKA